MGATAYAMDFIHFLTSPGPPSVSFAEGRDVVLKPGAPAATDENKEKGPAVRALSKPPFAVSGRRLATPCESGDADQTDAEQRQ
jgi:hypothetical protein